MTIKLVEMTTSHQEDVIGILNHYIETSFAAYRQNVVDLNHFFKLLDTTTVYGSYVMIQDDHKVLGFGLLEKFSLHETFSKVAVVMYFIDPMHVGQGLGVIMLEKLEVEAKLKGIINLVADMSSKNQVSIEFHQKHGFIEYGRLREAGEKFGTSFDLIYMVKRLSV